jgi:prefoldin subunit 4
MSSAPKRLCPVCEAPGTKLCAGCSQVGYCSKEHQREHWKVHKAQCSQNHLKKSQAIRPPESEVQVTWEDQQKINRFSRLNVRIQRLEDELKGKKAELLNCKDAVSEVESLIDDDSCRIKVGEVFIQVSNEEAEQWTNKVKKQVEEDVKKMEKEHKEISNEMEELKKVLYGKFGKAINLENSEQTINQ